MELRTFEIFTIKADIFYSDLLLTVDSEVDKIKVTEISLNAEFQTITFEILNELYKIPNFAIDSDDYKNEKITEQVPFNIASKIIGNGFSYRSSESSSTITELSSLYSFKSPVRSIQLTVRFPQRTIRGSVTGNMILTHYFQGSDVSDGIKEQFRNEKKQLIDLLVQNNEEVKAYFEAKKIDFINYIKLKINNRISQNKKDAEDLLGF